MTSVRGRPETKTAKRPRKPKMARGWPPFAGVGKSVTHVANDATRRLRAAANRVLKRPRRVRYNPHVGEHLGRNTFTTPPAEFEPLSSPRRLSMALPVPARSD